MTPRALMAGALLTLLCAGPAAAQVPNLADMDVVLKSVPDGPVAKVNGVNIGSREFLDLYTTERDRLERLNPGRTFPDAALMQLGRQCLGTLVEQEVVYQEALRRNVTATDALVEEGWRQELDAIQKNLLTDAHPVLSEEEILTRAGTTRQQVLDSLRHAILIEKMRRLIVEEKNLTVTDEEVAEAFKKVKDLLDLPERCHLKQVFVPADPPAATGPGRVPGGARAKAEEALKRIRAGQTFEAVAKSVSASAAVNRPVDLGTVPVNALPPFLRQAVQRLQPGEVSEVIESEFGYHIIQLVELLPAAEPSLETATPELRARLLRAKGRKAVRDFCAEVTRERGIIEVFINLDYELPGDLPGEDDLSLN